MTGVIDTPPLSSQPKRPDETPGSLTARELARWAWRQLTSMRTALILLMLLGVASIPGSLVPQARIDARAVAIWRSSHPSLTPLYDKLGLFHVYGSPWFSAIYILLMVSLIGCIVPRLKVYWRAAMAPPPAAPRNLTRLPSNATGEVLAQPESVALNAAKFLRHRHYRVVVATDRETGTTTVAAQRGYLREAGNLLFHLSVVVVLIAFALGDLFGYRGGVIVVTGQTFSNSQQSYDDYVPGAFFGSDRLNPFSLTLDKFNASFLTSGPEVGQPATFSADLTYRPSPGAPQLTKKLEVNHPLTIGNTSVFLVGNGYAPIVTVRDGDGKVVYSGPTVFLPENGTYASFGVIKAPDAKPTQIGFQGRFLPTYGFDKTLGAYSRFPDVLAPVLSLTAYTGDLGLGNGIPQSVYFLDTKRLKVERDQSGKPRTFTIPLGQTARLPKGAGTIRFDGVERWARLQLSATPAERFALGGIVLGLVGLLGSLYVRPRRIWVRARRSGSGSVIEIAGLDRREGLGLNDALTRLLTVLTEADR